MAARPETIKEIECRRVPTLKLISSQIRRPSRFWEIGRGLIAGVKDVTEFTIRTSSNAAKQADWF